MKKKVVVNNTSNEYWERMILYYKWFFTLTFLCFSVILVLDHTYFMGAMFLILGLQTLPLPVWVNLREKMPKVLRVGLMLLTLAGIYVAFLRIIQ
jgi:hypothetical protein